MSEQYLDTSVTVTNEKCNFTHGDTVAMVEAQFSPTKKGFSWMRWYKCKICDLTYREDEVVFIGGAPYCTKYKHYLDAE
jgi:hypothetical protein